MKKIISIALFFWSTVGISQNWCPSSAEWTYNYFSMTGFGFEKIIYEKDTVLLSQQCIKLNVQRTVPVFPFGPGFPPSGTNTISLPPIFTYSENDTVFFYYENTFHPTYFFNAQVGDTLEVINYLGTNGCDTIIQQVVDSAGTIQINNETLRFYIARHINFSSQFLFPETVTIIEKVGVIDNHMLPHFNCYTDGEEHTLRCYQDADFGLYQPEPITDCDFIITGIDNSKTTQKVFLNYFPNPTENYLLVEYKNGTVLEFQVADLSGKLYNITFLKNEYPENNIYLNVAHLNPGVYFIQLQFDNGARVRKKFIKQN